MISTVFKALKIHIIREEKLNIVTHIWIGLCYTAFKNILVNVIWIFDLAKFNVKVKC